MHLTAKLLLTIFLWAPCFALAATSTCYGTTSNGRIDNAVKLPAQGENFVGYSTLARWAGRTYVHNDVNNIIVEAYKSLAENHPGKIYKYAETGLKHGGKFRPHKTHQNGLSVDFFTPMMDEKGTSTHLATHLFNKLGYNIELDSNGSYENLTIDYLAMAAHIVALDKHTKAQGYKIWRVIFDPQLQAGLFTTPYGAYLKTQIEFSKKPSWVRHDEHYHVDFIIPCQKNL